MHCLQSCEISLLAGYIIPFALYNLLTWPRLSWSTCQTWDYLKRIKQRFATEPGLCQGIFLQV